jgi:hypothetical protein
MTLAQERVTVDTCDLQKCITRRPWQQVMVLRARPTKDQQLITLNESGDVAPSQVVSMTFVQCHWPSSTRRNLTRPDRKDGMTGITQIASRIGPGMVLGDFNIPNKNNLEDLLVHAQPQGQWRFLGNKTHAGSSQMSGPDWVLYDKSLTQGSQTWNHEGWYSDAHYPVCFSITDAAGLVSSQAVQAIARHTIQLMAGKHRDLEAPLPASKRSKQTPVWRRIAGSATPAPLPASSAPAGSSAGSATQQTVPTPTPNAPRNPSNENR